MANLMESNLIIMILPIPTQQMRIFFIFVVYKNFVIGVVVQNKTMCYRFFKIIAMNQNTRQSIFKDKDIPTENQKYTLLLHINSTS